MKFFAFTKVGIIRIIASSLMLSVLISTVILNYASREITAGNFFATLVFIAASILFLVFTKKNHPPLFLTAKGWLMASFVMCIVAFIVSAAQAEIGGFIGFILGGGGMLFVSPFYGFGYIFKSGIAVSIAGMISCLLIYFLPLAIGRMSERRRMARKYK